MTNPTDTIEITDDRRRPFYWLDDIINDIHAPSIRAAGIAVYTALVKYARDGLCQVGIETIAAQSGLSNREAVIAAISRLETARLVEVTVRPGHPNAYRILDPYQTGDTRPRRPIIRHPAENPRGGDTDPAENPRTPRGKSATYPAENPRTPRGKSADTPRKIRGHPAENPRRTIHTKTKDKEYQSTDDDASTRASQRSSSSSLPATWDELTQHYGQSAVQHARRVAADQSKRNDFLYIRGVLKRLAERGKLPTSDIYARPGDGQPHPDDQPGDDQPIWDATLQSLRASLPAGTYASFIAPCRLAAITNEGLIITAPPRARDWLTSRLAPRFRDAWVAAGGQPTNITFISEAKP